MPRPARLLIAALLLVAACVAASPRFDGAADASVVRDAGYHATVLGWHSWYGSYRLAGIGTAWCVDHGLSAPDADLGYGSADLADHAPDTRRAMAWLLGRWPASPGDAPAAAATMLVLHDLMGARYPGGVLDVDRLQPADMSGFGPDAATVLTLARARKADALAHSELQPPLALKADTVPEAGLVVGRVVDAAGAPVAGVPVQLAGDDGSRAVTGSDGSWTAPLPPGGAPAPLHLVADVPDLELHAFGPAHASAQRVATPATVRLDAVTSSRAEAPPPPPPLPPPPAHTLSVTKTGDASAYLPVSAARFSVSGQQVVDRRFSAGEPVQLPAGRYTVTEQTPPPGYTAAGPWEVDLTAGDAALAVQDHAVRGSVSLAKRDAATGEPVPGAVLSLAYDADHDGTFETPAAEVTSATSPVDVADLLPGDYELREHTPPPGYAPAASAVAVTVPSGGRVSASIADERLPAPTTTTTAPPVPATVLAAVVPAAPTTTSTTAAPPEAGTATTTTVAVPAPGLPVTGASTTRPLVLTGLALIGIGAAAVVAGRRFPW